jgi:wobble nucleotide-excising tRNase
MLKKFVKITNIGRFRHAKPTGDVEFRRFNLICAENGRGKTTLCSILRSLQSNSPGIIAGRKTLGSLEEPEVHVRLSNGMSTFKDGAWTTAFPDLLIFDGTYVSENVYAGDIVDRDHRRNLYRVIIGSSAVEWANRIDELDQQIRAKSAEIRNLQTTLRSYIPPQMETETFVALPKVDDVDAKIEVREQELASVQRTAQLQQRSGAKPIPLPEFPTSFAALLGKTFRTITESAEREVSEQLKRHGMGSTGESWLREGLRYIADDSCPFCGQPIEGLSLIQAYNDFFSREYHKLTHEIVRLKDQVSASIGEAKVSGIERILLENSATTEFWGRFSELMDLPRIEVADVREALSTLEIAARALLDIKAATPLHPVSPDVAFADAHEAFELLLAQISQYNAAIRHVNEAIDARKLASKTADARNVENEIASLRAQKARHTDAVDELCASETLLQNEKKALEHQKRRSREQLDLHTHRVIAQYGDAINRHLDQINAGYKITPPKHSYQGGTPSTSYQIVINEHAVDLGDSATPVNKPCFKNTLSAGDRGALALSFFLAQLENDADRAKKVVVVDDPFSSLDGFRRNQTVHRLYKCAEQSSQLIVLSHEPSFLKLLWDRLPHGETRCLKLARVGEENTTIVEWSVGDAMQPRYHHDLEVLIEFYSKANGEPLDVAQKLRPVLESFCRRSCPGEFSENDTMGEMLSKIRAEGVMHSLYRIQEQLEEINTYSRGYHHGGDTLGALEKLDPMELNHYVKLTLKLVGTLP